MPLASVRGGALRFASADAAAVGGLALAAGLWAAVGVGLGAAIRSQVPATVGALVWILVVENLGTANFGDGGRFLPGQAGHALASAGQTDDLLAAPVALVVLVLYVVFTTVVGLVLLLRRDIMPA